MIKTSLILPLLAVAALGAGCGGGYGDGSAATQPAAAKTAAAVKAATSKSATVVEMRDTTFKPGAIDVKVGDTVTFVNRDAIAHTATATAGAKFDSGTMEAGAKFEYVAKKAGTISYVCTFHPGMTGTINVTEGDQGAAVKSFSGVQTARVTREATKVPAKVTVPDLKLS